MIDLRERYVETLEWSLAVVDVDQSVERTVLAAVTLQFLATLAQTVAPLVLPSGPIRLGVQGLVLVAAAVAFLNTAIVARRHVIRPIETLRNLSKRIAAGTVPEQSVLDRPDVDAEQPDEIGDLARSFEEMRAALETVESQADALAGLDFDDPVLEEDVPGEFGSALSEMHDELERYTRELETVIETFGEAADAAQAGDLTARVDPDGVPEAYETLARDFDELLATLADSLAEAESFADSVAEATDEVGASAADLRTVSGEIADSVEEIADRAAHQREELSTASGDVSDLSATVEEIASSATAVRETASEADERASDGRTDARAAIDDLDGVVRRIETTTESVEELVETVDEVDEVAAVMESLADETNLLAINASIEAARAGGGGGVSGGSGSGNEGGTGTSGGDAAAGFAVVAEEVQNLSEEGRERAGEIRETITRLQRRSDATAEEVREMRSEVVETIQHVENVLGQFEEVAEIVAEIEASVTEVSDATDQQAEVAEGLSAHVREVEDLAAETATDSDAVASATEQQVASIDAVAADADSLSADADRLSELFEQFTLPERAGSGVESTSGVTRTDHTSPASADD